MNRTYNQDYENKKIKREDILEIIHDGDRLLCYGGAESFLTLIDGALEQFNDVELYTMFMFDQANIGLLDSKNAAHIRHFATFVSEYDVKD